MTLSKFCSFGRRIKMVKFAALVVVSCSQCLSTEITSSQSYRKLASYCMIAG